MIGSRHTDTFDHNHDNTIINSITLSHTTGECALLFDTRFGHRTKPRPLIKRPLIKEPVPLLSGASAVGKSQTTGLAL